MSTNPIEPPASPAAAPNDEHYRRALHRLFERTGGTWKLGLERVDSLMRALGEPQRRYPIFHVAGTNGKGSTVATLYALLRANGLRVARYTSPHLVDFSERIVVDGEPMTAAAITGWLEAHDTLISELGATFFEATTALAFTHFAEQRADVAVIEVGLGGRLDATNIVHPVAAGVTQIGFDHMEYLGDRLELIAAEKGGIFKAGVPAIIGERDPAIRGVLIEMAERVGASPILATDRDWHVSEVAVSVEGTAFSLTTASGTQRLATPLIGSFQAHNAAVALAMLRGAGGRWGTIADGAAATLPTVRLAGRFHRAGKWLFDVAHNADGAATVAANVSALGAPAPVVAVVSVLRDKDWRGILRAVSTVATTVIVTTAPTSPESRAWDLEEVEAWSRTAGVPVRRSADFEAALREAEALGETVLVTGSFHTVGDAMARLQVDPLGR